MKNLKFPGFIKSTWFITLFSTMIGVILGFYLTNQGDKRKLLAKKEKALTFVSNELSENKKSLEEYCKILEVGFDRVDYLLSRLDKNKNIIVKKDSLISFQKRTQNIFNYESFSETSEGYIIIHGEFDFQINSKLIALDLSHIIWDSYKQTEYLAETQFKCIIDLEAIYQLTQKFNTINDIWRKEFLSGEFLETPKKANEFKNLWNELIQQKQLLLQMYFNYNEILKTCN